MINRKPFKVIAAFCSAVIIFLMMANGSLSFSAEGITTPDENVSSSSRQNKYAWYTAQYADKESPEDIISIAVDQMVSKSSDVVVYNNYQGKTGNSIYTGDSSYVAWEVQIAKEGMYQIQLDYYPVKGKGGVIERSIEVNGTLPFTEAASLVFYRLWKDATDKLVDASGNEIRAEQVEAPQWTKQDCKDSSGLYNDPFQFYFKQGLNVIHIKSVKEPMVIGGIRLYNSEKAATYGDVKAKYDAVGYQSADDTVRLQAEDISLKSDQNLYPEADRGSASMEPYSADVIKLNKISSGKFQMPGQWARWNFHVTKAGLYKVVVRFKQASRDGAFCSRKILIDGQLPCREAEGVRFNYKDGWQCEALSTADGEVISFYLESGDHFIEMQVVLGDMADIVVQVEDLIYELNAIYRKIIIITGTTPDAYRDYQFEELIPDVIADLKVKGEKLNKLSRQIETEVGKKGSFSTSFDKLAFDVLTMANNPRKIAGKLENFKSNLGALGSWLADASKQPLDLDWIEITGTDKPVPKAEKGFFASVFHQVRLFISSFYIDYLTIGENGKTQSTTVKVWLGNGISGGRDQSQVIKRMVNQYFTPNSNIHVNFQLVAAGTLLPATLAGTGPDVSLQAANTEPVNYAMRGAVEDLTQFSDFSTIAKRFNVNAMIPYTYRGKVYALPETYTYPMLFYRIDILKQLGLKVPQTWDEVYDLIVRLNMNSMQFGLPPDLYTYIMLLYQNGCDLYEEDGIACALNRKKAVKVFDQWTQFYTSYKLMAQYDFSNRFRTGEMPVAIADFSQYNQLSVFAPEIKGLWQMVPVPGVRQEDGTINRSVASSGVACIIMGQTKYKKEAWEFLKWWTSTEMQVHYAKELESIMGVAARYPSANQQAVSQIAWSNQDYANLMEQWKYVRGIPEVPGSYITSRYIDFAFKAVVNNGEEPGQTILDYVKQINEEIGRKRKEFGIE